jgi:hypothetical protein
LYSPVTHINKMEDDKLSLIAANKLYISYRGYGTTEELSVPDWPDTKTLVSATSSITYECILKEPKL